MDTSLESLSIQVEKETLESMYLGPGVSLGMLKAEMGGKEDKGVLERIRVRTSGSKPGRKDSEAGRGQVDWDPIHIGSKDFLFFRIKNGCQCT